MEATNTTSMPSSSHGHNDTHLLETLAEEELMFAEEERIRRTIKILFCIAYGMLFVLGTIGNGAVIIMIGNIMSSLTRKRPKSGRRLSVSSTRHVFIYVLGLSIVDLLVILHLPFLIFEMVEGQWIFGTFMCKLYWYGESVNKLLSSFLMTVLSWDRYLAVCSPLKSFKTRTNSVAITVLVCCSVLATLLLYPVLSESTVTKVNRLTGERLMEETAELAESDLHGLTISKCIFDTTSAAFMLYTFAFGYVVPALLITFFYMRVILRLRKNAINIRKHSDGESSSGSTARFHKVTQRVVAVVLFYFFCWTPYWMLNIMSQFGIVIVSWSRLTLSSVFFGAHLLVCFNSAANPVLYALINRELRQQHFQAMLKRRQSLHLATNTTMEFIAKHSQRMVLCAKDERRRARSLIPCPSFPYLFDSRHDGASRNASVCSGDSQLRFFAAFNIVPRRSFVSMKNVLGVPGSDAEKARSSSLSNTSLAATPTSEKHLTPNGAGKGRERCASQTLEVMKIAPDLASRNSLPASTRRTNKKPEFFL
ncbi:Protein NPR-32 [Aphelenchoides avenae]|nr:Protein NPR-32 [Aphelenchus avenae]